MTIILQIVIIIRLHADIQKLHDNIAQAVLTFKQV